MSGQHLAASSGVAEVVVGVPRTNGGVADATGCWDLSTGVGGVQLGVSLLTSMPHCRRLPRLQSVTGLSN